MTAARREPLAPAEARGQPVAVHGDVEGPVFADAAGQDVPDREVQDRRRLDHGRRELQRHVHGHLGRAGRGPGPRRSRPCSAGWPRPAAAAGPRPGMARVAAASTSPTRMVKAATIIRSPVAAAWANCELYWMDSTLIGRDQQGPERIAQVLQGVVHQAPDQGLFDLGELAVRVSAGPRGRRACGPPRTGPTGSGTGSPLGRRHLRGCKAPWRSSTAGTRRIRRRSSSAPDSEVTRDFTRTLAVSWVPHWRAKVSNAISRTPGVFAGERGGTAEVVDLTVPVFVRSRGCSGSRYRHVGT